MKHVRNGHLDFGPPEDWTAIEHSVMQIVARAIDLQERLGEEELRKLPSLRTLFAAVRELTNEIGWADQAGDDGFAGPSTGVH